MAVDIEALINEADSRAQETLGNARNEIAGAAARLVEIFDSSIDLTDALAVPDAPTDITVADVPELQPPELDFSGEPGSLPSLQDVPRVLDNVGSAPTFTGSAPSVSLPSRPSEVAAFTKVAPTLDLANITFPDPPPQFDQPFGDVPTIVERDAPEAPTIVLPSFDSVAPTDAPGAVGDMAATFMARYREIAPTAYNMIEGQLDAMLAKMNPRFHDQMEALEGKLSQYLVGGTALTPAIEEQISERTQDRANAEYMRVHDTIYEDAGKRGLSLPDGAVMAGVQQARQAASDNIARGNIDLAVKQAELEQQNIQFAITTSANLRTAVLSAAISYHSNLITIHGQAINAAQAVVSALIEGYNAAVRVYAARLDAYKADAQVYEARARAALSFVEKYKAEVEALSALVDVDKAKIEAYNSRIGVLQSLASVYRTRVEAIVSRAELEKLKIDAFGAEVQAYSATVQGQTAAWQGYAAAISGEEAKARVFAEQVNAHRANVDAWRAQVEAGAENVRGVTARNVGVVQAYSAQWQAFSAKTQAQAAKASALVDFQKTLVTQYGATLQAALAQYQAKVENYRAVAQIAIERNRTEQEAILGKARVRIAAADGIARTGVASADMYARVSSSALSGMNTLVQTVAS